MATIEQILKSARRYSTYTMAREVSCAQKYSVPVLLGDDGKFWVASTTRQASMLVAAGYQVA